MRKIIISVLFTLAFANLSYSRTQSLVERSEWGTGLYYDTVTKGDVVYVLTGLNQIDVIDASDRQNPIKLNTNLSDCKNDFAYGSFNISGNVLAAACPFSIVFYDITNPQSPSLISIYDSTGYAIDGILLEGNRLFVAGGNTDIVIFDTADLSNIVELGRKTVSGFNSVQLKKKGNILYMTELFNQVGIYDISDPGNILISSQYSLPSSFYQDAQIVGDFLYIGISTGIQVVDVSDPANASFVKNITLDVDANTIGDVSSLFFDGTTLYGGQTSGKLRVIDLTVPDTPSVSSGLSISSRLIDGISLLSGSLAIANRDDGLHLVDKTDVNNLILQGGYNQSITPGAVSISGNKVAIAGVGGTHDLLNLDTTDQLTLTSIVSDKYFETSFSIIENSLLWAGFGQTLKSYSVTDLANPVIFDTQTLGLNGFSSSRFAKKIDNDLYVGLSNGEFEMYDISNATPVRILNLDFGSDPITNSFRAPIDVVRQGNYLFVSTTQDDLNVIDISDLANPSIVFSIDWSMSDGEDRQLALFGSTLLIARNEGLMFIDVQNPLVPVFSSLSGVFGLLDSIQKIDNNSAFVGNDSGEVILLDMTTPTVPVEIHRVALANRIQHLGYSNSVAIATNENTSMVKVLRINQGPVASSQSFVTDEDVVINDNLSVTDNENDPLTFTVSIAPTHGTVSINSDKSFTYTPAQDFSGTDSFSYDVADAPGASANATVNITINPVNDAAVITSLELAATEDTTLNAQLTATDVENDPITFALVSTTATGTLTLSPQGAVSYIPVADFFGTVTFEAQTNDGFIDSAPFVISINIAAVNDLPVVNDASFSTDEDTPLTGQITATDVDNTNFTFTVTQAPANGQITMNADGSFVYSPAADFNGSDSFQVKANDGTADSASKVIGLTVNPINDKPVITTTVISAIEDNVTNVQIEANDAENDTLTYTVVSAPTSGTLTLSSQGAASYTPGTNFFGSDSFQVKANDGTIDSDTVTISINIAPVNDTPVVDDASFTVDEDTLLSGQLTGSDVENQALTFIVVTPPSNGTLTLNADGSFEFTPNTDFNGQDSFEVKANDGTDDGAAKTIDVTVNPVNDTPTTQNQSVSVVSGSSFSGTLSSTDVDGDTLTYSVDTTTTNGTLSLSTNGSYTYTPNQSYTGNDSFSFTVSDPSGASASATVSINVTTPPSSGGGGSTGWLFLLLILISSRIKKF